MHDTIGHALVALGLTRTTWRPEGGGPGGVATGTFNPTEPFTDWPARYGTAPGENVLGWLPENYVGGHATGLNSQVTPAIAQQVLEVAELTNADQTDLDFVDGATRLVLARAIDAGLIVPPAPPVDPPAPPPVDPPAPPPVEPPVTPPPPPAYHYAAVEIPADVLADLDVLLSLPPAAKLGTHRHQRLLRIDSFLQTLPTLYQKVEG